LFEKRVKELGAEILLQSANSDETRQIPDLRPLISRGVDIMVIVPQVLRDA
jgi:D-xylose transport system substrate-binding protein